LYTPEENALLLSLPPHHHHHHALSSSRARNLFSYFSALISCLALIFCISPLGYISSNVLQKTFDGV
jgi:hypothetical protein